MGMEIPTAKILMMQKMMILKCNFVGKTVAATQVLESMRKTETHEGRSDGCGKSRVGWDRLCGALVENGSHGISNCRCGGDGLVQRRRQTL